MARYIVEHNYVEVVGKIWMPATTAAYRYDLSAYDVKNIIGQAEYDTGERKITRDAVEQWLAFNAGDFQCIDDFHASIGDDDFPWSDEESELTFSDCMYPSED